MGVSDRSAEAMIHYSSHLVAVIGIYLLLLLFGSHCLESERDVPFVDEECLEKTCGSPYQTCKDYSGCSSLMDCLTDCMGRFDSDNSNMKSSTHLCINKCLYMYEDIYFVALARCLTDNDCVKLPPYPSTCRYPNQTKQYRQYKLQDLKGGWWVAKGYNRAYDCLTCQHNFFDAMPFTTNEFTYRPTFYTTGLNKTLMLVNGSVLVDLNEVDNAGDPIELGYYLFGIPFKFTWYPLDGLYDGSVVYVYYCGSLLNWRMEGALVLSRSKELPSGSEQQIKEMISSSSGLDVQDFCINSNAACTNA